MKIWELLGLDMDCHRCVALVGGGGKTTLMYALARQARDAGRTVIITTTTHIVPHNGIFLTKETVNLRQVVEDHGIVTVGRPDQANKITGVGDVADCKAAADVVLVEADGAHTRPLKAPAEHEPVIPACADAVLAVAGLDCVGEPVGRICHRPERVCALLDKPGDWIVTPGDVAELLSSPCGGRKGVGAHMAFRCVLNKADTPCREEYAAEISAALARRGIPAAITKFTGEERGGQCWF